MTLIFFGIAQGLGDFWTQ